MQITEHAPSSIASRATRAGGDRLVEADRCLDQAGQARVRAEVVVGQGLLDEQQVERVEGAEQIGASASRYEPLASTWSGTVAEPLAERGDRFDVPSRSDLELDPAVAGVEIPADLVEQVGDRVGDADGDAALDRVARRAKAVRERDPAGAELGVEHRDLERGLGHRMALHARQRAPRRLRPRRFARAASGPRNSRMTACAPPTHSGA